MSNEAMTWALNLAPIPNDANGKPNGVCASVLMGLANHADPDGTGAFPAVSTLAIYARVSERTVQAALARLRESGVIRPCAEEIVAARISRKDRRPNGYDLDMGRVRSDLSEDEMRRIGARNKLLRPIIDKWLRDRAEAAEIVADGVKQLLHPVDGERGEPASPRANRTGCNGGGHGVKPATSRGEAATSPEPSIEPSIEPPERGAQARDPSPAAPIPSHGTAAPEAMTEFPADWQPCAASLALLAFRKNPLPAKFVIDKFVAHWAGRSIAPRRIPNEFAKWVAGEAGRNGGQVPTDADTGGGKAEAEAAWAQICAANQRGQFPKDCLSRPQATSALEAIGGWARVREMLTKDVPFVGRDFVKAYMQAAVPQRAMG